MGGGEGLIKSPRAILTADRPELFHGNDPDADYIHMLEEGFGLIGTSAFNGPNAGPGFSSNALTQAEKVHASAVVEYFPKYAGRGEPLGNAATIIFGKLPTYDYLASYWIKLKSPIFGVYVEELLAELKQKMGNNKGVVVVAVVKNSPAFSAGIIRGDVLKGIGEMDVVDKNTLDEATNKYAGKKTTVIILRDGNKLTKEILFNLNPTVMQPQ